MQQRIGIARAMLHRPRRPTDGRAVQPSRRGHRARGCASQVQQLWQATGATVLFVTHDVMEAVLLSNRVLMMRPGGVLHADIPVDLPYPRNQTDPAVGAQAGRDHRDLRGDGTRLGRGVTRHFTGRIRLTRDAEQWAFDRVVKETGKAFHFQGDGRGRLPPSVRAHDMISKHVGQARPALERSPTEEQAAGHPDRPRALLRGGDGLRRRPAPDLRDQPREAVPARVVDHCLRRGARAGAVHDRAPRHPVGRGPDGGTPTSTCCRAPRTAPCIVFIPGCDMTKEMYPHPL